ncbi:MAG: sigma factor-like helix-turn-helix DNA-binding protein [bacterium]|nr:sigma factor-like helix-turn-helix DNA-binding protein [bacterium]
MENLLEKMIKNKKSEELIRLDAISIVDSLFSELLDREKDILSRRFGLKGDKGETLEKIGNLHKLTRERVRQIEAASIKKIKKLEKLEEAIASLKEVVESLLTEHGGLIRRDYLLDILTVISLEINGSDETGADTEVNRQSYRNHFNFLISRLMNDDLELVDDSEHFNPSFKKKGAAVGHLEELAVDLLKKVEGLKKTFTTEELLEVLKKLEAYNKHASKLTGDSADITSVFKSQVFPDKAETINSNKILYSLMQAVKNLEQNKYGEWGIADWGEVKPKTVNDKIYLILKHAKSPLHFTEIAKKINEMKFDKKIANAATVHNELILDDRYVLVNRGTYGLKEWQK